jgi:hypothetical protein
VDAALSHAFLSHSSHDRDAALALERGLEERGLDVWLDDSEIRLGAMLSTELQHAVLAADVFVLLWSAAAAGSRWVASEWLMALLQRRPIVACVLDDTPLPQALEHLVHLDLRAAGDQAADRLARGIRAAAGTTTQPAPLLRSEPPELHEAVAAIAGGQQAVLDQLGERELDQARQAQELVAAALHQARSRWPLDPVVINLDGYQLKNAFLLAHWDALQSGRAPSDPLLERSERRFLETLSIDPSDPSALNGLGSILMLRRDLDAAEFFIRAAIDAARARGLDRYEAAEQDLALVLRYQR